MDTVLVRHAKSGSNEIIVWRVKKQAGRQLGIKQIAYWGSGRADFFIKDSSYKYHIKIVQIFVSNVGILDDN